MIVRDLQVAGQGMDPSARFGVVSVVDGGAGQSDSLYILFVPRNSPAHAVIDPPAGQEKSEIELQITCDDAVDDLEAGEFVYLAGGSARGVAFIDAVSRHEKGGNCDANPDKDMGSVTLQVSTVDGEAHGWILEGNSDGSAAIEVSAVAYFLDDSSSGQPHLTRSAQRADGVWVRTPIASAISQFEVDLVFSNGTVGVEADGDDADPDNNYDDINTVNVRLVATARLPDKDMNRGQLLVREYSTSVTPRNQLYTRNLD
jgi:hypothetical protein